MNSPDEKSSRGHWLLEQRGRSVCLAVMGILFISGCEGRPDIIVKDDLGNAVPGATITATSLSVSGQTSSTDTKGHAIIPWSIQKTKWISVTKTGYEPVSGIDVELTARPIEIILNRSSK